NDGVDLIKDSSRLSLLQITLKDAHVVQGIFAAIRPKLSRPEANVIRRLHWRLHAVPGSVRKRVGRGDAYHDPTLAANIRGHPHMSGNELVLHAHPLANREWLRRARQWPRSKRPGERERSGDQCLQLLAGYDVLLDKESRHRRQVALIVWCGQVMSRRHALYGVAELVHVVDMLLN